MLSLAEAGLMINAVSQGLFGQGMVGFLFPKFGGSPAIARPAGYTSEVYYSGGDAVSLNEFWANVNSPGNSAVDQVKRNFQKNWVMMGAQLILIPTAFRVGKNLARPAINQTNRLLKQVKLDRVVVV